MATTRLDLRLDDTIKAKAEKASALLGLRSLTEYVVKLMDDNSTEIIEDIIENIGLVNAADFETLKTKIPDDTYFKNFVGLSKELWLVP